MHLKLERQISRSRLLGVILCYFNTSSTNSILLKLLHSNLEWTPLRLSDIVHVHGIIIRGQCFPIYYIYMLMFILVHVPVQDLYVLLLCFFSLCCMYYIDLSLQYKAMNCQNDSNIF